MLFFLFFFKQKTAYEMRISDWSSDVCSSDLLLRGSELAQSPCAPGTLDMLARFCVLSRLREHENSNLYSKMRVYDGESLREVDPRAKSMQEYKDAAGVDEGMDGVSTRFAFKAIGRESCRERVCQYV